MVELNSESRAQRTHHRASDREARAERHHADRADRADRTSRSHQLQERKMAADAR